MILIILAVSVLVALYVNRGYPFPSRPRSEEDDRDREWRQYGNRMYYPNQEKPLRPPHNTNSPWAP